VAACNQLRAHLAVAFPAAIGLLFDLGSPVSLAFLARFGSQDAAGQLDEQVIAGWLKTIPVRGRTAPASVLWARLRAAPAGTTGQDGAAQAGITVALTATVAMLAAQIKALETGKPVQMLQQDAGAAGPSPFSIPAARPDPAYHRLDLFRARVQQVTAVRSGRNSRRHRRRRLQVPETRGNDPRRFIEPGHRRLSHRRPP
jgi:hypothetical protein